jgi:Glycosyltransferase family 87
LRTILLGQINLVLLALVVADALVIPARYRGMLIGLAAAIKILPGAFILLLVLKREWGAVGRAVAAFAVTVAVGAVFAPNDSWLFWKGGFINLSHLGPENMVGGDNQSLSAALMRFSRDISPPTILVLLMSANVMALGLVAAKRQIETGNDVNGLVCIAFASLLASPISWTHHWVWAVPEVGLGGRPSPRGRCCPRCGICDWAHVVGPTWQLRRAQRQLVAGRCMRVLRGGRADLPDLLCGEPRLFINPICPLRAHQPKGGCARHT